MTDGGDQQVTMKTELTGVTDRESDETYGQPEETGGCGRRMPGLLAGGGPADVASWVDGWQAEETSRCGWRTLGRLVGGRLADVASGAADSSSGHSSFGLWPSMGG